MILKSILLISGLWLLTACTIIPPRVEVYQPAVVVPVESVESSPPARHCPPGHAKKGWC
jgi:starvation-inducible outer membrane lipoprotein